jgi:hypothetical protein
MTLRERRSRARLNANVRLHVADYDKDMVTVLPDRWLNFLRDQPESGMSYHILTIILRAIQWGRSHF